MSKRIVHTIDRITYSFSRDEITKLLLEHGEDCRGHHLLPNPKIEWGSDGVSLVYEYVNEKKDDAVTVAVKVP